jgi:hypothetical protein
VYIRLKKVYIRLKKVYIRLKKVYIRLKKVYINPVQALYHKGLHFPQVFLSIFKIFKKRKTVVKKTRRRAKKRLLCVSLTYKTGTEPSLSLRSSG